MMILWTDKKGRECAARFTREDEVRNFVTLLKTRHAAEDIQLPDADGLQIVGD